MSFADNEPPLGDQFLQNPYQFLQSFVRNMNNQIFLSEYQLSHLYGLLLLKKQAPWNDLKPTQNIKIQIQEMVVKKITDVKKLLESLSQVYQDKVKKNTFNQIQRLMNIIKAKNKSIYIQKDIRHIIHQHVHRQQKNQDTQMSGRIQQRLHLLKNRQQAHQDHQIHQESQVKNRQKSQLQTKSQAHKSQEHTISQEPKDSQAHRESQSDINQQANQSPSHFVSSGKESTQNIQSICQTNSDQKQVLSLFYGISNLPNLSSLALDGCLEYNAADRFIKFKMSKNYIMTIKNQDQLKYDRTSVLRNVSNDLYTHHLFPYLTALELFKARQVCQQWMDNVKDAWHSTFKREMFVQLMACQFCKQIQFYYKIIQLRNPFFQKISLLMHALLQIIQWQRLLQTIANNTIHPHLRKVLIILLLLLGQSIPITNLNSITQQIWSSNKQKLLTIKQRISKFLCDMNAVLSINQLMKIKIHLLDDPFMRVQEINTEDKTPLLLVIFIKQMTLQQILKNNIYFSQEYLMNTKRKLDNISSKMPQKKGFLEGVYKILLLRSMSPSNKQDQNDEKSQSPNFHDLLNSIFTNSVVDKPDFVIKTKSQNTSIYFDKATKLDIIVSTVRKMKLMPGNNQSQACEQHEKIQHISHQSHEAQSQNNKQAQKYTQNQNNRQKSQNQNHKQCEKNFQQLKPKKQFSTVKMYDLTVQQKVQTKAKVDFQQNIYDYEIAKDIKDQSNKSSKNQSNKPTKNQSNSQEPK